MSSKPSRKEIDRVFTVFNKNYLPIPLEVYGKDPYKNLISTLLSSRTKDETTLVVSQKLFQLAPTIADLNKLDEDILQNILFPVGFYKTKAKYLKNLSHKIINQYKSKIPDTREELMNLSGVGRKTANLVLNRAFGKPAIAVDTHVHRITNTLGWVNTISPEKTEIELMKIIPQKYWESMNRLFVSIGKRFNNKKLSEFLKQNNLI